MKTGNDKSMEQSVSTLLPGLYQLKLSDTEFNKISAFVKENFGIKILPVKKIMLQGRLYRRLRELNMNTFGEYVDYLFSREGQSKEVVFMMNEISTNKTDFFREAVHFDYLKENILPALDLSYYRYHPLSIWSAGCSSGEEVYTLAMVLEEFRALNPWFNYHITGTDISTKMLESAATAIYKIDKITPVPIAFREKYLLKGKEKNAGLAQVVRELRHKTTFERINFMDDHYRLSTSFDIVFCRNVLIYFDIETQETIINKICRFIKDNGVLFLGHSESITRMKVPLKQLRPTIFNRI